MGGQYASFLRSATTVLKEIEDAASRWWRFDKRGKPDNNEMRKKLKKVKEKNKGCQRKRAGIKPARLELDHLRSSEEELKEKR